MKHITLLLHLSLMFFVSKVNTNCNGGCPINFSCNPYDSVCYRDPEPATKPSIWLGEAPDQCDRTNKHCHLFGLEYDFSHPKGDGEF